MKGKRGQDVVVSDRMRQSIRLRSQGLTYRQIAQRLGTNRQSAYEDVQRGLAAYHREIVDATEELAALELERLERPVRRLAKLIHDPDTPPDVFFKACEAWRRLSESRRKLMGMDAPTKIAPVTPDGDEPYKGMTDERIADYLLGVIESAAVREDQGAND